MPSLTYYCSRDCYLLLSTSLCPFVDISFTSQAEFHRKWFHLKKIVLVNDLTTLAKTIGASSPISHTSTTFFLINLFTVHHITFAVLFDSTPTLASYLTWSSLLHPLGHPPSIPFRGGSITCRFNFDVTRRNTPDTAINLESTTRIGIHLHAPLDAPSGREVA